MRATCDKTRWTIVAAAATVSLCAPPACRPTPPIAVVHTQVDASTINLPVPEHVRRLAVWYPRTFEQEVARGYRTLEQATFQLKSQRAGIKIIERADLQYVTDEQRLQLSGHVADDSAVRVGRWLGADSVVLFRIEGPTWRERMLARFYGRMPPFVVSSKIVSVETGEVFYHDIVTAHAAPPAGEWGDYGSDYELQPALRSALDRAVAVAIGHLNQSFR